MQFRHLSRLAVLPVALGLLISGAQQSSLAKTCPAKRHHHHGQCSAEHKCPGEKNLMCTLMCEGSFKNLSAAIKKAGLAKTLEGKGPFTLFAPDDKAFWKQPKGFIDGLSEKQLKDVLTYHVLPRKVMSADLANMRAAKTVEGQDVMLDNKGGTQTVDGAIVTKADIKCSNGVIHVIDEVLVDGRGK